MNHKLLQIPALLLFSAGIIGFVAYQSGYIGSQKQAYQSSHNGGAIVTTKKDSVKPNPVKTPVSQVKTDTTEIPPFMAGSKTIIIRKPQHKISDPPLKPIDTTKIRNNKPKKFKL